MSADGTLDQIDIFLSYAREDGSRYVRRFIERLRAESPRFAPWYDGLIDARLTWDRQIEHRIRNADVMLVLATRRYSYRDWCRAEVAFAQLKNVTTIVARMHRGVEPILGTVLARTIDFADGDREAWPLLLRELELVASLERSPNVMRNWGASATDAADRRHDVYQQERELRERQERRRATGAVPDPASMGAAMAADPTTASPSPDDDFRVINAMPAIAPTEFHDRVPVFGDIDRAFADPAVRVVLLTGPGGCGKTALLREMCDRLRAGKMATPANGFVYFSANGHRPLTASTLLQDLVRLIRDRDAQVRLRQELRKPATVHDKATRVLTALGRTPAVVAIDNVDDLVDDAGRLRDGQLREALVTLARHDGHRIRVMIVGRKAPAGLFRALHGHVVACALAEGLPEREVWTFLSDLDHERVLGLDDCSADVRQRLAVVSEGSPRFVELVHCALRSDPDLTVDGLLDTVASRTDDRPDADRAELLAVVLARLDRTEWRVTQALAVFDLPVAAEAVDYLLFEVTPNVDSRPILDLLHERHVVRRDGDRFYLPPEPDARLVRGTLPAGSAGEWLHDDVFSLPALRSRAAGYFAKARALRGREPTRVEDLDLEFSEIRLRVAAGEITPALRLMAEIDERFLTGWGHSRALRHWRRDLQPAIRDLHLQIHNLSFLVSARDEADDPPEWLIDQLRSFLRRPSSWVLRRDCAQLGVQLADVLQDDMQLVAAVRRYRLAAILTRLQCLRFDEVMARTGMGVCLARTGELGRASAQLRRAARIATGLTVRQDEAVAVSQLGLGWLLGLRGAGRAEKAEVALRAGLAAAERFGDLPLIGRLLDALARELSGRGRSEEAVGLARRAADIGVQMGHTTFSRDAYITLAFVSLRAKDLPGAAAATAAAVQRPAGIRSSGAWVTRGVVLFRQGDTAGATEAFHRSCTEAWERTARTPQDFQGYDTAGLALCGLALCDEPGRLRQSVDAYRKARAIAPAALGAREHATTMLSFFGDGADQEILDVAIRAANGENR